MALRKHRLLRGTVVSDEGWRLTPSIHGPMTYREGHRRLLGLVADEMMDGSLDWGLSPDSVWDSGGFPVPLTPEDRKRVIGRVREAFAFLGYRTASEDQH